MFNPCNLFCVYLTWQSSLQNHNPVTLNLVLVYNIYTKISFIGLTLRALFTNQLKQILRFYTFTLLDLYIRISFNLKKCNLGWWNSNLKWNCCFKWNFNFPQIKLCLNETGSLTKLRRITRPCFAIQKRTTIRPIFRVE